MSASIGSIEERTTRLSNALRYSGVTLTPKWAILIAADEAEARYIVLGAAKRINASRLDITLTEYMAARADKLKRYRVDLND